MRKWPDTGPSNQGPKPPAQGPTASRRAFHLPTHHSRFQSEVFTRSWDSYYHYFWCPVRFFVYTLYQWRKVLFSVFLRLPFKKSRVNDELYQMPFFSMEKTIQFFFCNLLMCKIHWFSHFKPILNSLYKTHLGHNIVSFLYIAGFSVLIFYLGFLHLCEWKRMCCSILFLYNVYKVPISKLCQPQNDYSNYFYWSIIHSQ